MGFTSQDTPHWYWNYGLEAIFLSPLTWLLAISSPPQSFLPVGIGVRRHQRLILATPFYWRRLILATPLLLGDASSSFLGPLNGYHRIFDFDFSQRPGTGRYKRGSMYTHHGRAPWRHLWKSCRGTSSLPEGCSGGVLLANHEGRQHEVCTVMRSMSKAR